MDANGLSPEQQALLASIMGKSPQAGGGAAFSAASVKPAVASPAPAASAFAAASSTPAAPAFAAAVAPSPAPSAASAPADPGRMLSQAEIDALIASMT